jgi:hypothetical protein
VHLAIGSVNCNFPSAAESMRPRRGANMLVPVGWLNAASTRGPQRPSGTNPAIGTVTGALARSSL